MANDASALLGQLVLSHEKDHSPSDAPDSSSSLLHDRLDHMRSYTQVEGRPYSMASRIESAKTYKSLGYPDLAAGEAYRVLLLVDEIAEEGEYFEQTLSAAKADLVATSAADTAKFLEAQAELMQRLDAYRNAQGAAADEEVEEEDVLAWARLCWSQVAYEILVECLTECGSLRSASDFCGRALMLFPDNVELLKHRLKLNANLRAYYKSRDRDWDTEIIEVQDYPDRGYVRRELYPWNDHEPDRYSPESISFLNAEMTRIAPKLEVRVTDLPVLTSNETPSENDPSPSNPLQYIKQLGVFAKEDLQPGEEILKEKSVVTAVGRLHEAFCDACSVTLPNARDSTSNSDVDPSPMACDECSEVFFCSTECYDLAQSTYHPSLCGGDFDTILQDVPAAEAADSLYALLLLRTLAMAETQALHPLDLKETKYVWGDYHGKPLETAFQTDPDGTPIDALGALPQTLPFSFTLNILMPLHMLEKMGVNIWEESPRYDIWIFNTLYAKFRGNASGRMGRDGKPELGALHSMWCLANHSCDPNVAWKWEGSIKFWTREERVRWKGKDGEREPGVKKGQEILSHYCDIRLPVKERREWAQGALGGDCMCERCVWESALEDTEG